MRFKIYVNAAACAAAACMAALATGCGGSGNGGEDGAVSDFEIREVLKTASRSYMLRYESGDTAFLTLSATVQWPLTLGPHPLTALQDTLLGALGVVSPYNVDQAMSEYVDNVGMFDPEVAYEPVDSVPATTEALSSYELSVAARVAELTEQTVTYQVYNYAFAGGAHPNYASRPFTFDLEEGRVLTFDALFKPGAEAELLPVVEEALAAQMGVSGPKALARAGVFMDQMYLSRELFVSDGQIVFHYNPYEIGPYALGSIDVAVTPFVVEGLLTTRARQLLL